MYLFELVSSQGLFTFILLTIASSNVTIRELLVVFLRNVGLLNPPLRRLEGAFLRKHTQRDPAP